MNFPRCCYFLILTAPLLFAGCDNTGGKQAVSGTITLQGQPLDKATISFYLLPEAKTPAAEALVTNGKYSIPAVQGLMPGSYRVKITAPEEFNITPEEYAAGKTAPPPKDRVPANYNTESQETVEVKAAGANQFDYQIQ